MEHIQNGESGALVRTKINSAMLKAAELKWYSDALKAKVGVDRLDLFNSIFADGTPGFRINVEEAIRLNQQALGVEHISGDWTLPDAWTQDGEDLLCNATTNSLAVANLSVPLGTNRWYELQFEIKERTSGNLRMRLRGGTTIATPNQTSIGVKKFLYYSDSNTVVDLEPSFSLGFVGRVGNISVREIDLSKCVAFQDSAGTLPVTSMEQPLGMILDTKLGEPARGPELCTNPTALPAGVTQDGDWFVFNDVASQSLVMFSQGLIGPVLKTYNVVVEIESYVQGQVRVFIGQSGATPVPLHQVMIPASNGVHSFVVSGSNGGTGTLTVDRVSFQALGALPTTMRARISVREVPGNHFIQPSNTASRPIVSRRVNLLTATTSYPALFTSGASGFWTTGAGVDGSDQYEFESGTQTNWTTLAVTPNTSYVFSQDVALGTATAAAYAIYDQTNSAWIVDTTAYTGLSAALQRKSVQFTTPANCTAIRIYPVRYIVGALGTVFCKNPDLRLSIDANLPPYQRVTSSTDYDESGFPAYARFDGLDDWLETGVVDLTSTDEMTVIAGVTKLSDAAVAVVVENGPGDGSFTIHAPRVDGSPDIAFISRGSISPGGVTTNGRPSPGKHLICGLSRISTDFTRLRIDSVVIGSTAADQGTGNYGNRKVYIGRRTGTSMSFNGRIYGVTVIGKLLTDSQLAAAEQAERQLGRLY